MTKPKVVSRAKWLEERKKLLAKEKKHSRQRDELTASRMALPWVKIRQDYRFTGPEGDLLLGDLFADKSQLLLHHFMFQPEWDDGCKHCSFMADHIDPIKIHLEHRDLAIAAVSIASISKLQAFKKRMGWSFQWVSSEGTDFNRDFEVTMDADEIANGDARYNFVEFSGGPGEMPGVSAFCKDTDGTIYHTYSTFGRGLETVLGTYNYLDLIAKGRDEDDLPYGMAWLRLKDSY